MKIFEKIKIEKEREIRIFGIAVLQYGKKIISGGIERYVKLFPTSFEDKTLKRILKDIPEQYDDIWIIRTAGLGEAQLLNFAFDLTANNVCVVSHRSIYADLFKMYSNVSFFPLNESFKSYAPYLHDRNKKFHGKNIHIWHCTLKESLDWLKKHQQNDNSHLLPFIQKLWDISAFTTTYPSFTDEFKASVLDKVSNLNTANFVFLVPESNGTSKMPPIFWEKLTDLLSKKEYDVFVNTQSGFTKYGKSAKLTVAEASYLASLAKSIIGLRTGFIELLAALKERGPLYTLYTPFRKIDSENFLSTYSLKNYPFIQTNNIVELTTSQDNYEIVLDIFQKEL